mmetsp:Transcript_67004/g.160560  ORF Transcript_67004/g.160560 Transcript_67004/m.160560 type:complete len:552 (-) Transcript_67004:46-1701(-)
MNRSMISEESELTGALTVRSTVAEGSDTSTADETEQEAKCSSTQPCAADLKQQVDSLKQEVQAQTARSEQQARDSLLAGCVCFWILSSLAWSAAVVKGCVPFATFAETACNAALHDGKVFVAPLAVPAVLFWMSHYIYVLPNAWAKPPNPRDIREPGGLQEITAAGLSPLLLGLRHHVVNACFIFIALLPTLQVFHTVLPPTPTLLSTGHAQAAPSMVAVHAPVPPLGKPPPLPPPMPPAMQQPPMPPPPALLSPHMPSMDMNMMSQRFSLVEVVSNLVVNNTLIPRSNSAPGMQTSLVSMGAMLSVHDAQAWVHAMACIIAYGLFAASELCVCMWHQHLSEEELQWRQASLATLLASLMVFFLNKLSQVSPSLSFFALTLLFSRMGSTEKLPSRTCCGMQYMAMAVAVACVVFGHPTACVLGCWTFRYEMMVGASLIWQHQLIWAFSSRGPQSEWLMLPFIGVPARCVPWAHVGLLAIFIDDMQKDRGGDWEQDVWQSLLLVSLAHCVWIAVRQAHPSFQGSQKVTGRLQAAKERAAASANTYGATQVDP